MDKNIAIIILSLFGFQGLITGFVILVKKEYFAVRLKHKDFLAPAIIGKVSGKQAKSSAIGYIVYGIFFIAIALALYLWGN